MNRIARDREAWRARVAVACLPALAAGPVLAKEAAARTARPPSLYARYYFTAEFTYHEIVVDGTELRVTYFQRPPGGRGGKAGSSLPPLVAQRPYWTKADLTTKRATLTASETGALRRLVLQSGFMRLKNPAPPRRRTYPEMLQVRLGGKKQEITCHGGPEPMPPAFKQVREALAKLANTRTKAGLTLRGGA